MTLLATTNSKKGLLKKKKRTLRAWGVVFFFFGSIHFSSFHFHFASLQSSLRMNPPYPASLFSRPSLCIISVFPLPLCVQFNQQARSHSYRHHAILVLILMPISLLPLPRHAPLFFFFFVQDPFFPHFFYCGWECSVAIATIISAFLPVAHATHNAPSSSFPRIERSVSLTPSHALQFPPLSLFRYPALHFYVAVLVLVHLFFSSPPAFLTVSAINRGVRPPTRNLARHAPWSNGARFVSTTQWVRLFPLENTWKRYGRYHGSSGRRPNAATTRMARLNKYGCDTNHRSCIDRNPSRASRIRQGARGPARWTRSRGSELRTWPVCKNTSEAATVCTQTTIILPFADCPLRPPDRASRVAPQEKKLRTVHRACFFPTQLKTHTRHPHKALPSSTAIPNSTRTQIQIRFCPPSSFLLPLAFARVPIIAWQRRQKSDKCGICAPGVSVHILTIRPSPGPPAVRPPFRHHGGCFLFDLAAGSLTLEKIGKGHTLARPSMAGSMRRTMRHCSVRTIRRPEIKDETAKRNKGATLAND